MLFSNLLVIGASLFGAVLAHSADESAEAIKATNEHVAVSIRSLESCQGKLLRNRDLHNSRLERREAWINAEVERRGIQRRSPSFTKRSEISHIFERQVSCVLAPEVTIGPYWLDSMPIRKDNRETQPGVPLFLELQFINVADCQPLTGAYIDIWHANSTGVYSGFKIENTAGEEQLRGVQPVDSNGVANFTTVWPGHYTGRAVHTHIMVRTGGSEVDGDYVGGEQPHIGQVFYDQDLIAQVENVSPYSTNNAVLVTNTQDFIFQQQNTGYDAIARTELVGATIQDGVFASISIGVRV